MSWYTKHTALGPLPNGNWRLAQPLRWEIGRKGSDAWVNVPSGFESDLASIPIWARAWLNPADARFARAAILHDYLLSLDWAPTTAAAEFAEALRADGVSAFRTVVMGLSVLFYTLLGAAKRGAR